MSYQFFQRGTHSADGILSISRALHHKQKAYLCKVWNA